MFNPVTPQSTVAAAIPVEEHWLVLTPEGEIDLTREEQLASMVDREWGGTNQNLLVDLNRVTFMDSSGLRWLVTTKQKVEADGQSFAISLPEDGRIRQLLEITALDRVFSIKER
ncbi:MAG TPA: STAS domain-containing protein [Acidimicrobiia bacterium]|jgi:anti-sigma B factor antagonist